MTGSRPAWMAISGLRFRDHDDALRAIAKSLRDGDGDEMFFDLLAEQLDPDTSRNWIGTKLVVRRTKGSGAPKKAWSDIDLAFFLSLHVVIFEEKAEMVFAFAKQKFGYSRSKCAEALRVERKNIKDDPENFERFKKTAFRLRELGDPEFQLL